MKSANPKWAVIAAIVLPPLSSWLSTQIVYSSDKLVAVTPLAHLGMIVGVLVGVVLLSQVSFENQKMRKTAFAVYIPGVVIVSWLVGIVTACANGDCG